FFVLLVVAGNETTRNAISHGMLALTDNPDQKKLWLEDFEGLSGTAVEEIIRWSTPVIHFRRTCATADTEVGGPGRGRLRGPLRVRRAARPERARRLRWWRPALLPRRAPGAARDQGDVR